MDARYPGRCRVTRRRYRPGTAIVETARGWAIDDAVTRRVLVERGAGSPDAAPAVSSGQPPASATVTRSGGGAYRVTVTIEAPHPVTVEVTVAPSSDTA